METKRGGDKWKWELNDPLPEFRIRSWHMRGLKTATPRLNFEGPLIARQAVSFPRASEYEIRKTAVYTLPFPRNQKRQEGMNSFTQLDWISRRTGTVTGTFHVGAAAARLRQHGLLQPGGDHAGRQHAQLHRHADRSHDALRGTAGDAHSR